MKEEHAEYADDDEGPEVVLCVSRYTNYPVEEQGVEADDDAAPDKAPLFCDDRKNEV